MSNTYNDLTLEELYDKVIEDDSKGSKEVLEMIDDTAQFYDLNTDDDRDEILQFIAEDLFYNRDT